MEELEATATQGTQATQPADPGPLESAPESAELVVKLLKNLGTPWNTLEHLGNGWKSVKNEAKLVQSGVEGSMGQREKGVHD